MLVLIWPYLFITGDFPLATGVGIAASVLFVAILATARTIDTGFLLLVLLVLSTNCLGLIFGYQLELFRRREFVTARALVVERERYRELMIRVLPEPVATRLNRGEVVSDMCDQVVVLFADIVGFTAVAARDTPAAIVGWLNAFFEEFDRIVERHGLEKLKTIGDAYMAAHGLHGITADCAKCIEAALDLVALTKSRRMPDGTQVQIRVGVHVGPALAGIIGQKRFLYDIWGDTVNVASRMESASQPGGVLVTSEVRNILYKDFDFDERPPVLIKGKGEMVTWMVRGRKGVAPMAPAANVPVSGEGTRLPATDL
jgi:class 3 adenylate cyclase